MNVVYLMQLNAVNAKYELRVSWGLSMHVVVQHMSKKKTNQNFLSSG